MNDILFLCKTKLMSLNEKKNHEDGLGICPPEFEEEVEESKNNTKDTTKKKRNKGNPFSSCSCAMTAHV